MKIGIFIFIFYFWGKVLNFIYLFKNIIKLREGIRKRIFANGDDVVLLLRVSGGRAAVTPRPPSLRWDGMGGLLSFYEVREGSEPSGQGIDSGFAWELLGFRQADGAGLAHLPSSPFSFLSSFICFWFWRLYSDWVWLDSDWFFLSFWWISADVKAWVLLVYCVLCWFMSMILIICDFDWFGFRSFVPSVIEFGVLGFVISAFLCIVQ